jgi:lipid II:glycine glycyltransferase (peptidoglycan interpeptide bridge formation enzyme)
MRIVDSIDTGLDEATWDRFVASDPEGHLLQTWGWGALKGAFGWSPLRVAVEQDGALLAGAQVLYRRFGPLALGYIPKGPVLPSRDAQALELLWRAIRQRSRRLRAVALKVEPEWRDDDPGRHAWLRGQGFCPSANTIQPRRTILLDLRPKEDEILARMKSKWRYNIRLSERRGVTVRQVGREGLPAFYDLMRITGERDGFGVHSYAYYEKALELFQPQGRAALLMAYYEGEPLAGLMPYAFNGQAWYMYGASSNRRRELMPNHQLQWRAMQWARAQGCTQYDLWGIADEDPDAATADLGGVQRFKEGFGGQVVRYVGAYDLAYARLLHRLLERAWAWRRSRGQAADS